MVNQDETPAERARLSCLIPKELRVRVRLLAVARGLTMGEAVALLLERALEEER